MVIATQVDGLVPRPQPGLGGAARRLTTGAGTTVAVTGASGYIGSYIVAELLSRGYGVRCCVRGCTADPGKAAHLTALPGAAERLSPDRWLLHGFGPVGLCSACSLLVPVLLVVGIRLGAHLKKKKLSGAKARVRALEGRRLASVWSWKL